jgi:hypothetical protein
MYANSFVRRLEITPQDFAQTKTVNDIISRGLATCKLHPNSEPTPEEKSVIGMCFTTSDNAPYIQAARQQAAEPTPRKNHMFRGGPFHDMKAIVTYNNSFHRSLWFAKLVTAWRPSPAQLEWVCAPVSTLLFNFNFITPHALP